MNKITKDILAITILVLGTTSITNAQVTSQKVGINPTMKDPSAVFEIEHASKGALLPRVQLTSTTVAAPVTAPANALTVFNTNTAGDVTPGYYYWSTAQTKWIRLKDANDLNVQDLRLVGTRSHITQDAGVGADGTSVGTGTDNIGIGSESLNVNTSGFANVGLGTRTLAANTTGNFNVGLGNISLEQATADGNTGLGHGTGYALTTGSYNTLAGAFAGHYAGTGWGNIAIGYNV